MYFYFYNNAYVLLTYGQGGDNEQNTKPVHRSGVDLFSTEKKHFLGTNYMEFSVGRGFGALYRG